MCAGRADGCAECVARGGLVGGRELGAGARAVGERQRAGARRTSGRAGSWAARRLRAGRAGRAAGGRERAWRGRARGGARQAGTRGAAGALGTAGLGVAWAQPVRASWASWARLGFCAL